MPWVRCCPSLVEDPLLLELQCTLDHPHMCLHPHTSPHLCTADHPHLYHHMGHHHLMGRRHTLGHHPGWALGRDLVHQVPLDQACEAQAPWDTTGAPDPTHLLAHLATTHPQVRTVYAAAIYYPLILLWTSVLSNMHLK